MKFYKHAVRSAFYGALGPLFNKMTTSDPNSKVGIFLAQQGLPPWTLWVFNVVCIILMLSVNTRSVKFKMLSFKEEGAFLGTTLIFSLGYFYSSVFGWVLGEDFVPISKYIGFALIIGGVIMISSAGSDSRQITTSANAIQTEVGQKVEEDQKRNSVVENQQTEIAETQETLRTNPIVASEGNDKEPLGRNINLDKKLVKDLVDACTLQHLEIEGDSPKQEVASTPTHLLEGVKKSDPSLNRTDFDQ